jgi:hypothetical protein
MLCFMMLYIESRAIWQCLLLDICGLMTPPFPTNEFFMAMRSCRTHSTLRSQPWCENIIQQSSMKVKFMAKPKQNMLQ